MLENQSRQVLIQHAIEPKQNDTGPPESPLPSGRPTLAKGLLPKSAAGLLATTSFIDRVQGALSILMPHRRDTSYGTEQLSLKIILGAASFIGLSILLCCYCGIVALTPYGTEG